MAKKKYIDYKKQQQELFKRTEGYAAEVRAIYLEAMGEIINLVKGTELEDGKPFSFAEYGYSEEVTPIFRAMYSRTYQVIRGGVQKEWLQSNEHNDGLVKSVFGEHSIEDHHFARYFLRNKEAMDAFFARKTGEEGLNLSQKVWKYNGMYKEELENALDLAIGEGTPANRLATKIKNYLQEPDKFYRRFRVKIGDDKNGNPVYGSVWKRRIWDKEIESYRWINDNPKKYHPGQGVYRSSYRNAQRLARTETNIAYRTADYERWQKLDFVIGVEIKLSNNHPVYDICDELKGVYPKGFKWVGWHPNCRCYMVPILAKEEELDKMLDNILDGRNPDSVSISGEVTDIPKPFISWAINNTERINMAKVNGTLPYFYKDNEGSITDALNGKRELRKSLPNHIKERRKEIRRLAIETLLGRKFALNNLGTIATISNRGIKEWLNQPFVNAEAKNEALLDLKNLLGNSVYRGSGVDKHMATATMHLFETVIAKHKCWIIVRQFHNGTFMIWSVSDNPTILDKIHKKEQG